MKTAAQRERLLISASSQSLASVPELPPLLQNIDKRRLGLQLMMLHDLCAEKPVQDVQCLAKILSAASQFARKRRWFRAFFFSIKAFEDMVALHDEAESVNGSGTDACS